MGVDAGGVDEFCEVCGLEEFDFRDFVGGAEAVEEVHEWDAGAQGGHLGDGGGVVRFLDGAAAEHGEAGLAAGHDVGVVAEDAERVGGDGAGPYFKRTEASWMVVLMPQRAGYTADSGPPTLEDSADFRRAKLPCPSP